MALHIVFHYPVLFFPILFILLSFFSCSFLSLFFHFYMFCSKKRIEISMHNNKDLQFPHTGRSCPVIYKLIRKEVVCNGRCEAKAFIFLAISSRESVLDWNEQMMSTLNSSVPSWTPMRTWIRSLSFLSGPPPWVNHMPVLGWKVVIHYLWYFGQVSPLIYTARTQAATESASSQERWVFIFQNFKK